MATVGPGNGDSTDRGERQKSSSFARARITLFGKRPSKPSRLKEAASQQEAKDSVDSVLNFHSGFSEQIVDVLDRPERMNHE